jgi:hypothetical protein
VTQQQLDLLKFTAAGAAQFGAGTAQIVRGDTRNTGRFDVGLDELPYDLFA